MTRRPSARIAFDTETSAPVRLREPVPVSPLLVVSVDDGTPELHGIDWVRIDGSMRPLDATRLRRRFADHPAMFDVPGPRTRRRSLLTPTEDLVFAAAEEFEWVNLREVDSVDEIDRARAFLSPETKLSASIHSSRALRSTLGMLSERCDAVLLDAGDLHQELGARATARALRVARRHLTSEGTASMLITSLWAALDPDERPGATTDRIDRQLRAGYRGLVLTSETLAGDDAQHCVDVARVLVDRAGPRGTDGHPDATPHHAGRNRQRSPRSV